MAWSHCHSETARRPLLPLEGVLLLRGGRPSLPQHLVSVSRATASALPAVAPSCVRGRTSDSAKRYVKRDVWSVDCWMCSMHCTTIQVVVVAVSPGSCPCSPDLTSRISTPERSWKGLLADSPRFLQTLTARVPRPCGQSSTRSSGAFSGLCVGSHVGLH